VRSGLYLALAAMTVQQTLATAGRSTVPLIAAAIIADIGIDAALVGVYLAIQAVAGFLTTMACGGFILRYGALRMTQVGMLALAIGLTLPASGWLPFFAVGAFVGGLGQAVSTPSSSHLLGRLAPPRLAPLVFSIKQTGVPAGAALAGAMLPALSLGIGWRATFVALAVAGVAVIAAAQPIRAALDTDLDRDRRLTPAGVFAPLALVRRSRELSELVLIGFCYAATQVCVMSFIVVYLTDALGWSLVAAGFALTVTTLGGVAGRIVWGWVADRLVPPRRVIAMLGLVAFGCSVAMAFVGAAWPAWVVLTLAAVYGASAIGWNGVQLAEIARHAPRGAAGAVTGASGFITFSGVVAGPPIFAALAAATGSYRAGFVAFGVLSGVVGAMLLFRGTRGRPAG